MRPPKISWQHVDNVLLGMMETIESIAASLPNPTQKVVENLLETRRVLNLATDFINSSEECEMD